MDIIQNRIANLGEEMETLEGYLEVVEPLNNELLAEVDALMEKRDEVHKIEAANRAKVAELKMEFELLYGIMEKRRDCLYNKYEEILEQNAVLATESDLLKQSIKSCEFNNETRLIEIATYEGHIKAINKRLGN